MNWPNRLSLIRIACVPVLTALILVSSDTWAAAAALVVFCLASATDFVDGYMARKYNLVTNFGKFIDPVADKLLVLSAMICLCGADMIPAWVVVIILVRELAVDGLRLVAVERGRVIAAGKLGKIKTTVQIAMVISFLQLRIPLLNWPVVSQILMAAAVVMTLWSGVDYFIRNKEVLHG